MQTVEQNSADPPEADARIMPKQIRYILQGTLGIELADV